MPGRAFDLPVHPRSGRSEQSDRKTRGSACIRTLWHTSTLEASRRVTSLGVRRGDKDPRDPKELSSTSMAIGTFNISTTKGQSKVVKTRDGTDVAARYFVYKLYEATDGQWMQWRVLHGMGESAATIARAVERGWVILQGVAGKPLQRNAALTEEGRRLARRGR
jgi:hypothetical protein